MFPLLVHFSDVLNCDEESLLHMISSTWQQKYQSMPSVGFSGAGGQHGGLSIPPFVAVFIIESRLAVVWLRTREAAEQIVGPQTQSAVWIVPRSRMTFRFSSLQSVGGYQQQSEQYTSIVEVTKAVLDDMSIDLLRDWQMLLQPVTPYCDPRDISVTGCRLLIRFSSVELAKRSAWQLNDYLMNMGSKNNSMMMNSMGYLNNKQSSSSQFMVRIIPINELKVVSTVVQGSSTLFEIVKQIQQQNNCSLLQFLEEFLRKSSSAGSRSVQLPMPSNDSPIVLSLSYVSAPVTPKVPSPMNYPASMEEQVYLVCPSVQDSRAIEMQGFLQLLPQSRLCVVSTVSPQFPEMRPQFSINNTNNFSANVSGGQMRGNNSQFMAQNIGNRQMGPGSQYGYDNNMNSLNLSNNNNYNNNTNNRNTRGNMGMMNNNQRNDSMSMISRPFILWDMISCRLPEENKLLLLAGKNTRGGGPDVTSSAVAEAELKIVDYLKSLISSRSVVPIPVIVFVSIDQANNYPLDALTNSQSCKLILVPNSNNEAKGIENAMKNELDSLLPNLSYSGCKASLLLCTSPYVCNALLAAMMHSLGNHEIAVVYGDGLHGANVDFSHPLVNTAMPWSSVISSTLGTIPSSLSSFSDNHDGILGSNWNKGSNSLLSDSFLGGSNGGNNLFKSGHSSNNSFLVDDLQSAINSDLLGGSNNAVGKNFLGDDGISVLTGTTSVGLSFSGNNNIGGSSASFANSPSIFEPNAWDSNNSGIVVSSSNSMKMQSTSDVNSHDFSAQIELTSTAMVDFIEKSIQWAASSPEATALMSCRYLYGEDTSGYDHASICKVSVEKPQGKPCLVIRGKASAMVDLRKQRVQRLLQEVSRNQQYCSLPNTWSNNHRQALQGSEMMDLYEEEFKVSVSFQIVSGGQGSGFVNVSGNANNQRDVLVAYFLSTQVHQIAVFMRILQDMTPKEAIWKLPANSSPTTMMLAAANNDSGAIESFHLKYAVKLEVVPPSKQSPLLTVYAWGFDDSLEKVSSQLTGNSGNTSIVASSSASASIGQGSLGPPPGLTVIPPSSRGGFDGPTQHNMSSNYSVSSSSINSGGERSGIITNNSANVAPAEPIKRLHRGTYSFADREAGIFFFAFEQQFRDYLEKSFSVLIDDTAVETNNGPNGNNNNNNQANNNNGGNTLHSFFGNDGMDFGGGNGQNKNVILKISFYGNSASNVTAARAYLEQLNTTNLARVQLFLPQVSAKKYKEIHNKKIAQFTQLNNLRLQDLATAAGGNNSMGMMNYVPHNSQLIVDPLHQRGFINIRMKPPMNSQGIRKMTFPSDVTVTICGSILVDSNKELLKEVEAAFNSIPSDYFFVSVSIPYTHPLKKRLTVKTSREEIVSRYGLVSLKWEEACRATGNTGTAKIWAMNQESLDALLDEIRHAENMDPSLLQGPDGSVQGISLRYTPRSFFEAAFAASAAAANNPTPMTVIDGNGVEFSAISAINADGSIAEPRDGSEGNSDSNTPISQHILGKVVVGLPDLTLRYVLLAPPLHTDIRLLLQKWTEMPAPSGMNVKVKYPYRDRNDPNAAVLFEGEKEMISQAAKEVNSMIQSAAKNLRAVQVTMTEEQHRFLISNDLSLVKQIQGQAGIHLKLDPTLYELDAAKCLFDMRFVFSNRAAVRRVTNFGGPLDPNEANENTWSEFMTNEALVATEISSPVSTSRVAIFDKKMTEIEEVIHTKNLEFHGVVMIVTREMLNNNDNKESLEAGQCVIDTVTVQGKNGENQSKQIVKLLMTSQTSAGSLASMATTAGDDESVESTGNSSSSSATSSIHGSSNVLTPAAALVQNELRALIVKGLRQCQDLGMVHVCLVLPSSVVGENFADPLVAPSPYHSHAANNSVATAASASASGLLRHSIAETITDFCKSLVSRQSLQNQMNIVLMLSDDCDSATWYPTSSVAAGASKTVEGSDAAKDIAESGGGVDDTSAVTSDSSAPTKADTSGVILSGPEKFKKVLDAMQTTSTVISASAALAISLLKVVYPQVNQQKQQQQSGGLYGNQNRFGVASGLVGTADQPKINIIACSVALPRTFYSSPGMQQGNSTMGQQQRQTGKTFLIKGLSQGIQGGLELIRFVLSSGGLPPPPPLPTIASSAASASGGFSNF